MQMISWPHLFDRLSFFRTILPVGNPPQHASHDHWLHRNACESQQRLRQHLVTIAFSLQRRHGRHWLACGRLSAPAPQQEKAMNATKTLICILTTGAMLGATAPVFADSGRYRGHDQDRGRYSSYDRHDHRNYNRGFNRGYYRDYYRRPVIAVRRPYIVEQPAYYAPAYYPPAYYPPAYYSVPAPVAVLGAGAVIGAVIGGYIDSQSRY
jgi:hypothetical protein